MRPHSLCSSSSERPLLLVLLSVVFGDVRRQHLVATRLALFRSMFALKTLALPRATFQTEIFHLTQCFATGTPCKTERGREI